MKRKLSIIIILIFLVILTLFFLCEYKTTIKENCKIYDSQFNLKGSAEFNVEITSVILKQYMKGEIILNSKSYSLSKMEVKLSNEGFYQSPLRYYDEKQGGIRYYGYMYYNRNHDIFIIVHDRDDIEIITNENKVEIQNFIDKIGL